MNTTIQPTKNTAPESLTDPLACRAAAAHFRACAAQWPEFATTFTSQAEAFEVRAQVKADSVEEPAPGFAAAQAAESIRGLPSAGPWEAHDDDGTGTLPCVLSEKVNPGGNWYVAQCRRYEDAVLIAAAPELADALELFLEADARLSWNAREQARKQARAALRKAGRS